MGLFKHRGVFCDDIYEKTHLSGMMTLKTPKILIEN
jgi:hypothetical protein